MSVRADWGCLGRAQRDAAYNNLAAVAEAPRLVADRKAASAAHRAAHPRHLDLPYENDARLQWDLYPAEAAGAPCLVFVHGGYWMANQRQEFASLAAGVARHGWAVAMPGYSLAPAVGIGRIVTQIRTALDWLVLHGPAHGIRGKIIVSGWSAGGHLAAMVLDHPGVSAGLAISGIFELGPLRETYLNEKLQLTEGDIAACSPLRLAVVDKPLGIAYGSRELPALIEDSRDLHALRAAAHAPGPLIPIAGADHFTILDSLSAPDGELVRQLLSWP